MKLSLKININSIKLYTNLISATCMLNAGENIFLIFCNIIKFPKKFIVLFIIMDKKIFVAGHRGLVGGAILRELQRKGYKNFALKTHSELDLENTAAVDDFFNKERPDWVFLAAAKVGGIYANNTYPVDFMLKNLKIQNNIFESSFKYGVKKFMFLGSSCI